MDGRFETPEKQVAEFVRAGADGVTVHVEASTDVAATLAAIRTAGARPGLALNPPTPLERARPFADRIDLLLVMSVNPGWGGQPFVEGSMEPHAACAPRAAPASSSRWTGASSRTTPPRRSPRAPTFSSQAPRSSSRPTTVRPSARYAAPEEKAGETGRPPS